MESSPGPLVSPGSPPRGGQGGRAARERILRAAGELFYADGINTTGMERLTEAAHVSKRTFYQHFPSKAALVEAYLDAFGADGTAAPGRERALYRADLSPRDRLLGLFSEPTDAGGPIRGCPFHNVAVELAGGTAAAPARAVIAAPVGGGGPPGAARPPGACGRPAARPSGRGRRPQAEPDHAAVD